MAVADNNPERRNLNIASLCIIVFYLAEGNFVDSKIKLPLVNVAFANPEMLCFIFWTLLFWFALRYWQTHKGLIDKTYLEEIKIRKSSSAAISYIKSRTGKNHREADGFVPKDINRSRGCLSFEIGNVQGGNIGPDGTLVNFRTGNFEFIPINGVRGCIFHLISFVSLAFLKPGFGNYVLPYILFSFACILGLVNSVL